MAGKETFDTIIQQYYQGAFAVITTYAVSDLNSFNNLGKWVDQIETHASPYILKFLLGNKTDLPREVDKSEGNLFAQENNMIFRETSAKDDVGITEFFKDIG